MGAWFHIPGTWPWAPRAAVVVALVLVPSAMMLAGSVRAWLRPADPSGTGAALMVALGTFILAYLLAVGVTELLLDAGSQPNQRLLAPVQLTTYLLLATVIVLATDRLVPTPAPAGCASGTRWWWCSPWPQPSNLSAGSATARQHFRRSSEPSAAEAAHDPLRALPPGIVVFTDDPSGLWLYAGLGGYLLPTTITETTGQHDRSYPDEVHQVEDIVEQRRGLIVITPGGPTDYGHGTSVRTIGRCANGDVVLAVSGTPAALAASHLCPGRDPAALPEPGQPTPPR